MKDAEQELKSISTKVAEDNVTTSKSTNASILETPLDILKRRVKSDIIIQVYWKINNINGGKSVSFTLEAFDAYTNKRISTSSGTTNPSNDVVPVILEKAIKENAEPFDEQMKSWYNNQKKNGRAINLTIHCWDNWTKDLETEIDGKELIDCIQEWLKKHAVNGVYNLTDATENMAQFEQLRIPLYDKNGHNIDARYFVNELRTFLKQSPYNITSKLIVRGLGEVNLILGEK